MTPSLTIPSARGLGRGQTVRNHLRILNDPQNAGNKVTSTFCFIKRFLSSSLRSNRCATAGNAGSLSPVCALHRFITRASTVRGHLPQILFLSLPQPHVSVWPDSVQHDGDGRFVGQFPVTLPKGEPVNAFTPVPFVLSSILLPEDTCEGWSSSQHLGP